MTTLFPRECILPLSLNEGTNLFLSLSYSTRLKPWRETVISSMFLVVSKKQVKDRATPKK